MGRFHLGRPKSCLYRLETDGLLSALTRKSGSDEQHGKGVEHDGSWIAESGCVSNDTRRICHNRYERGELGEETDASRNRQVRMFKTVCELRKQATASNSDPPTAHN